MPTNLLNSLNILGFTVSALTRSEYAVFKQNIVSIQFKTSSRIFHTCMEQRSATGIFLDYDYEFTCVHKPNAATILLKIGIFLACTAISVCTTFLVFHPAILYLPLHPMLSVQISACLSNIHCTVYSSYDYTCVYPLVLSTLAYCVLSDSVTSTNRHFRSKNEPLNWHVCQ